MHPPKFGNKILLWFLREDLAEEVIGDLEERFACDLKKRSPTRARLSYYYQVFNYCRPFAIRKLKYAPSNQYDMYQNYFKTGFRNLLRNKFFSAINVSGMSVSIACFVLISLFIWDELKFDRHVNDHANKYRIYNESFDDNGAHKKIAMVPPKIAPTLQAEYPEVSDYVRIMYINSRLLFKVGDTRITEPDGGFADPSIFRMFSLTLIEGNPKTALTDQKDVAISETLKQKYFKTASALGETILIDGRAYKVAAVYKDFDKHSHLQLNYLMSIPELATFVNDRMESWGWNQFNTYVELKSGTDPEEFDKKLLDFAKRNAWPVTKPDGGYYIPHLMALTDVHLKASDQLFDIAVRGNLNTVYILSACALFILIIAVLNFVNLSTARAMTRFKEVGIRKVVGALRTQLMKQFVIESIIVTTLGLMIAVIVVLMALPQLNSFTEKNIDFAVLLNPLSIGIAILCAIAIGVAAGAYPAFFISRQKPVAILGKGTSTHSRTTLRKGLVVLQFVLSFILVIATIVVSEQHTFMRTADIGFDKDNVLVIPLQGEMSANLEHTKQLFSDHPAIESASLGYGLPGEAFAGDGIIDQNTKKPWHINMLTVDHDYIKMLGLELVAGRDFDKNIPSDVKEAFIISEATAKMLGYPNPELALGHPLAWNRWDNPDSLKIGQVIGVVKDIQLNSMRDKIAPVVLHIFPFAYTSLSFKVSGNLPEVIEHLEKTWSKFNTDWPFEYRFLDENFSKMYKAEAKLATLFNLFSGFTIFVACLGLFGLVVYTTAQRHKEISIRKVLGASSSGIVVQLSRGFLILIAIAFCIAIPLSYFAASQWLQDFEYHIPLRAALFFKAGIMITLISIITIGLQSLFAANSNPVDALKEQ